MNEQETIQDLLKTLKAIDKRAKNAYKMRPGHDEDIAMIGMMAENAVLKLIQAMITNQHKPSQKEISAFLQGMEWAAQQITETPRGCQEALKIRREARTLQLLNERKPKQ